VELHAQRDVPLGNLSNIRDLGGYPAADGRRVRWRRIYRGASLHRLVDSGRPDLERLGLAAVVDLRRPGERAAGGWPDVLDGIAVHPLPLLPDGWHRPEEGFASPAAYLSAVYDELRRLGRESVRAAFGLLARPESYPLMFFCAAGKDRTGLLAALVLGVLGVPEEHVLDDYELSGDRVVALVDHFRATGALEAGNPMIDQSVELLRAPRAALAGSLGSLRREFGGVPQYLAWCGVPDRELAAVRGLLLE
jgi:protein-tyrosine phosphatase